MRQAPSRRTSVMDRRARCGGASKVKLTTAASEPSQVAAIPRGTIRRNGGPVRSARTCAK